VKRRVTDPAVEIGQGVLQPSEVTIRMRLGLMAEDLGFRGGVQAETSLRRFNQTVAAVVPEAD
jgi:hypothetical protein